MGKFREAAAVLFKREFGIYGIEKIMHIAEESGYKLDSYGNVLHVENEKEAFDSLCGNIEKELGPIAVIGSKTALMRFFAEDSGAEDASGEQKKGEVLNEKATYPDELTDELNSYMGHGELKAPGNDMYMADSGRVSYADRAGSFVYADDKFPRIYCDYILILDGEFKIIEANGHFMDEHRQQEGTVIGRKICDLMECSSGHCPAGNTAEGCCPVKKTFELMAPVELHMTVNGKAQQWRTFPFISNGAVSKKMLVHIMESPLCIAA